MSIGWNFPSNNNGEIVGIGEAGIETFRGSLFSSLAREICQNSLDARRETNKPVRVEFSLENIPSYSVPGIGDLTDALRLCRNYWNENRKTVDFFDAAIKTATASTIRVLRISDFNTTGLTGSDKVKSSPWQDLVKSSGVSNKGGESGGSYGIGKNAPYACSDLRTIFYSTMDKDGLKAHQGVSKLVSFQYPNTYGLANNIRGEITQGKGYYGEKNSNSAVKALFELGSFKRTEIGTDVYVLGFVNKKEWADEIIKALIEGFILSFYQNSLEVIVNNQPVNKKTIPELIEKYKDEIPLTYNYYQVLTSEETTVITEDFDGLGEFELRVLIQKDFRRKVLIARNNGMKIFDMKNISGTIPFAGICVLKDTSLNEYFREMENPQHNSWEPDRHSNAKEAQKKKKDFSKVIKSKVLEVGKSTVLDEMDAVGAGDFIPDIDVNAGDNKESNEAINNDVKEFTAIEKVSYVKANKGTQQVSEADMIADMTESGILDDTGEFAATEYIHNDGHKVGGNNSNEEGRGSFAADRDEDVHKSVSVKPLKLRLFLRNKERNEYKLTFRPEISAKDAFVEILLSGEQSNTPIEVRNSQTLQGKELSVKKNKIYVGDIEAGKDYPILFSIKYSETCSMEVVLNGYKV